MALDEHFAAAPDTTAWYESKTAAVLEKYGRFEGRVHYHIGPCRLDVHTLEDVRRAMWEAQEQVLATSFRRWRKRVAFSGKGLDVGCGLGGSMLWLLGHGYLDQVDGLTIAESHVPVILDLARVTNHQHQLRVHLGNAITWTAERAYDLVYSVQAPSLFDRAQWLGCVKQILRPGGTLVIDDYLIGSDPSLKPLFDRAYAGNIGTRADYLRDAAAAGFELLDEVDLTRDSADFWELCARYAELSEGGQKGWHQTPRFHRAMRDAQRASRYEHRGFLFRLR